MKYFNNLKIASKLIVGFLLVTALTVVVGVVGVGNLTTIDKAATELYQENTMGIVYSGTVSASFQRLRYNYLMMSLAETNAQAMERISNTESLEKDIEVALENYKLAASNEESLNLANEIEEDYKEFTRIAHSAIDLYNKNDIDGARRVIMVDTEALGVKLFASLDDLVELDAALAASKALENTEISDTAITTNVVVIGIIIVASVTLSLIISRTIVTPIKKMNEVANRLALGDTDVVIDIDSKDETGLLAKSFNAMIDNIKYQVEVVERFADGDLTIEVQAKSDVDVLGIKLKEMVLQNRKLLQNITLASDHIASSARQVSESSIILSQGAAEQASSVEELTASLEEVSSQTNLNAQKANDANSKAAVAQSNADLGTSKMKDMLQAMDGINESSANISSVIKVIEDIAFQTNILALNAAVEAARAGHLGKGFAVVAEEVRNLAARSASAAKETTDMIASSIKKSEDGQKIARETADALSKIVDSVGQANRLVTEIAMASNDQAMSIGQINLGIEQVLSVVQSNSATSEENAAASEELASQSEILKDTVSKYRL